MHQCKAFGCDTNLADDDTRDFCTECTKNFLRQAQLSSAEQQAEEYTGGKVSYYEVPIEHPTREGRDPYTAECNDIIEALEMNFAEGEAFKALWRRAAARKLVSVKKGYDEGLYDAQKVVFYGQRELLKEQHKQRNPNPSSQ